MKNLLECFKNKQKKSMPNCPSFNEMDDLIKAHNTQLEILKSDLSSIRYELSVQNRYIDDLRSTELQHLEKIKNLSIKLERKNNFINNSLKTALLFLIFKL